MSKRRPLRPVSPRRLAERDERRALVDRVKARDRHCQGAAFGMMHRCQGELVVHEVIPRSAWRAGYLVDDNCLLVCWWLNGWIEDHTAEATELGLARWSWERP